MSNTDRESIGADEMLDFLCWEWASTAERFFPPDETAEECMESLPEDRYDDESLEEARAMGWEEGQHGRAYIEAVENYRHLEKRGFDPRERAEREIQRSRDEGLDLPDIDWSWYEETPRLGGENGEE